MWIDSHCHLDFHKFDEDRDSVIARARHAGVSVMVNAGDDLKSSLAGLALAREHSFIFCTFGVHPNEAATWSKKVEAAFVAHIAEDRLSGDRRIVAMGEVGLDYHRMGAPKAVQKTVFREQLHLAVREDLPVVIHCRDAFEGTIAILEEENIGRAVFHCFDGDLTVALRIWEKGWLTSFTAMVSYPRNTGLREVVAACPSDRFMLETDAPFLPHQDVRGQRNESSFLPRLGKTMAKLRTSTVEEMATLSTKNARAFFGI